MGPNRKLVCFTFLVLTTLRGGAAAGMAAPESAEAPMAHMEQGTLSDFGFYQFWFNVGNFWLCQLFPATVNDTLITFPWNVFRLNPQIQTKVKIQVCTRAEIGSCQYYGNASNGLPPRVHGVFWTDGLGTEGETFSGAGPYNPAKRRLTLDVYNRGVAVQGGSSTFNGLFYTISSIPVINAGLWVNGGFDIVFNEDISFGQITPTFTILGIKFTSPQFLTDWTMQWEGQGVWHRVSRILFVSATIGDYRLRSIIDGQGRKDIWFDRGWLTYQGGAPVNVPYFV